MSTPELLKTAADALEAGEDPFGNGFLLKHKVTADQCFSLASQLAIGARIVAEGMVKPRSLSGRAMLTAMVSQL